MLSSVSKLADKTFVIGFLLPSLVFCAVISNLYECPSWLSSYCSRVNSTEAFADLTYFALIVWMLAVLLLALNYSLYRIFEGYAPPLVWFPKLREKCVLRRRELQSKWTALKEAGKAAEARIVRRTLLAEFPYDDDDPSGSERWILPNTFGNRLRAFEVYSYCMYGADAIAVWPRLSSVIPKAFQSAIEDAQSQVNFFMNLTFLAIIMAVASLVRLLVEIAVGRFHMWPSDIWLHTGVIVVALITARAMYVWACDALPRWGEMVKSAVDCYLPALTTQIGYTLPGTEDERRLFWKDTSQMYVFRRRLESGKWVLTAHSDDKLAIPKAAEKGSESE